MYSFAFKKRLFCLFSLIILSTPIIAQLDSLTHRFYVEWAKGIQGPTSEYPFNMDIDSEGNIYVVGVFRETVDFDPGPEVFELTSKGSSDIFVLKLNKNGEFVWGYALGGPDFDQGRDIAIDEDGNIFISGLIKKDADLNPKDEEVTFEEMPFSATFILKLDKDANKLWAKMYSLVNFKDDNGFYRDKDGTMYLTGYKGNIYVKDKLLESLVTVIKLDAKGEQIWEVKMGTEIDTTPSIASLDVSNGTVFITGYYNSTLVIDDEDIEDQTTSESKAYFLMSISENGDVNWFQTINSAYGGGEAVLVSKDEALYVAANFSGSDIDIDVSDITYLIDGGNVTLMKLSKDGKLDWATQLNSSAVDINLAEDKDGDIYVANGSFYLNISKLSNNGILLLEEKIKVSGSPASYKKFPISVNDNGDIFVAGTYTSRVTFENEKFTTHLNVDEPSDMFFAKYTIQPQPVLSAQNIINNELNVYPNPAVNHINIEASEIELNYSIFDLTGTLLKNGVSKSKNSLKVLFDFPKGSYILKLSTNSGKIYTRKFLIL